MPETRPTPPFATLIQAAAFLASRDIALKHLRDQGHAVSDRAFSALFSPAMLSDTQRLQRRSDQGDHA